MRDLGDHCAGARPGGVKAVRLLPSSLIRIEDGTVLLEGRDLTTASDAEMLEVRGGDPHSYRVQVAGYRSPYSQQAGSDGKNARSGADNCQ